MDASLRPLRATALRLMAWAGAVTLVVLCVAPPLGVTLLSALPVVDSGAWLALWRHPLFLPAWGLSVGVGVVSTGLSVGLTGVLVAQATLSRRMERLLRWLPAYLATPHLALAVALALWLAPSGWWARGISPWLTGWTLPPDLPSLGDPWGLGLITGLVLKEVPFLTWVALSRARQEDVRRQQQALLRLGASLGHAPHRAWVAMFWPALLRTLRWPAWAVLVYGLSTVEMALVLGPSTPPTLGVLAWQGLQDVDPAEQALGACAAATLALSSGALVGLLSCWPALSRRLVWASGQGLAIALRLWPRGGARTWQGLHLLLWAALLLGSVTGAWPFPALWPETWTFQAWAHLWRDGYVWGHTLSLGVASASLALVLGIAWLRWVPTRWQGLGRPGTLLLLALPGVAWVGGAYTVALQWHLEGQWLAVCLSHQLMVLPYVLLTLTPAWQAQGPRWRVMAAGLGWSPTLTFWRASLPLLRPAVCSAWAVGFAVSVSLVLPTLFVGAGRWPTLATEALALSAGGQRSVLSALAVAQCVLPMAVFALAARLSRPRRFDMPGSLAKANA